MSHVVALGNDRRLAIIAGAGATLSIAALLARMADKLPAGPATIIVLIGATIGLRVAFLYAAKSATAPARARVLALVSNTGLAIAGVTVLATLPHLTQRAGIGTFTANLVALLWTLAILTAVAGPVRTLGWRAVVGAGMTGFLALTALAGLLGRPVVAALGTSSLLAVVVWVPLIEELSKAIPVAFVAFVALRRTALRPSALDLMLVGAWSGAGFTLYENAMYGRGGFHLADVPVISLVFPNEMTRPVLDWTVVQAGHLVYSALIGLGVGLALLYRRRIPRPGLVLLAAFLAAFLEHATMNALDLLPLTTTLAGLLLTPTFGGRLCSILLIVGTGYAFYMERRAIGSVAFHPEEWVQLPAAEAQRRSTLLARAQGATSPVGSSAQVSAA